MYLMYPDMHLHRNVQGRSAGMRQQPFLCQQLFSKRTHQTSHQWGTRFLGRQAAFQERTITIRLPQSETLQSLADDHIGVEMWRRTDNDTASAPCTARFGTRDNTQIYREHGACDAAAIKPAFHRQQTSSFALPLHRLFKRVFTVLDPLRLHAVSGTFFLAYAGYETVRSLTTVFVEHQVPDIESPWILPVFMVLSAVKDATGFQMAIKHRRGALKNVMAISGLVDFTLAISMVYFHPSFEFGSWDTAARALMIIAGLPAVYWGIYDPIKSFASLLESRNEHSQSQHQHPQVSANVMSVGPMMQACFDTAVYFVPLICASWLVVCLGGHLVSGGWELRQLVLQHCPRGGAFGYTLALTGLWAGNCGTFAVSLRDRRLIDRSAELALTGIPFALFLLLAVSLTSVMGWDDWWFMMGLGLVPGLDIEMWASP